MKLGRLQFWSHIGDLLNLGISARTGYTCFVTNRAARSASGAATEDSKV